MTTAAQTRAIHALKRTIPDFTDEDYAELLKRKFKRGSSTQLTQHQAGLLIEELKQLGGRVAPTRRASETAAGPYAGKLQALWIAGYNLGIVRSRDDKALIRFVERQTGIAHPRFLTEAADAMKAIEALKKWLARDGGVEWPSDRADADAAKAAVAKAVARRCFETGAFTPFMPGAPFTADPNAPGPAGCWPSDFESFGSANGCPAGGFRYYAGEDWDTLANKLGAKLRRKVAPAKKPKKEAA